MPDVSVLIASVGRPSLVRCVRSILASAAFANLDCEVIVADDSKSGEAEKLIATNDLSDAVQVVNVGSQNISIARNACLNAARAPFAAFVDDDEWVDENWLERLMTAASDFSADAVFGSVVAHYDEATPDWLKRADPFTRVLGRRGEMVKTGLSGNVLIRLDKLRGEAIQFDEALGRLGGEDTDLFHRLYLSGGRLIVADDAVVHEEVPLSRSNISYMRRRAVGAGYMFAHVKLRDSDKITRSAAAVRAALVYIIALALSAPLWIVARHHALKSATRAWSNLGKIRMILGRPVSERE